MASALPARLDDLIDHVTSQRSDGGPLDHVSEAVAVSAQLGELADHLIGHFVDQARRAGSSWTEIGRSMGVSKQAAQQRFVPRASGPSDPSDFGLFSRFTPKARRMVVNAQQHARRGEHAQVGIEHLLLALVGETDAIAARAIEAQGVPLGQVEAAATAALGPSVDSVPEHIPFGPQAKKLLELTAREALRLGHNYIGTEHILLGILSGDDQWPSVFAALGVERGAVETWILGQLRRRKP